ncbi:hypothetical protein SASPL_145942 [Salvia splendens]|uniref:ABC transporter domain-containing protein n=1 Tax=Salvia splendens TaxID=180675 RepID=A0A8X8WIL9_SALSN|nr:hypothetical protein SASPL_145942 [Salvia splendens]
MTNGVPGGARGVLASPTLGHLLQCVGDETPAHQALEISGGVGTRSILFVLSFTNITYSVKVRRKLALPNLRRRPATDPELGFSSAKTILNNVSGEARDGEIMAVMGASGSEKSTLIDALANRMAKGSVKGSITLNGEQLESRMLKVISAYVMQDDLLFPMLTVEETLMFCREHCQSQRKSSSCKP